MKTVARNFIILHAMWKRKQKFYCFFLLFFFSDIMVQKYGTCDHDLSQENKILIELLVVFSIIVINMIKPLAKIQIKAGSTMIKESHSAR